MAREELVLYLVLAPAFGGTRFGPFEGLDVRVGSDASRSDIVVPESLGARPAHVRVTRQGSQRSWLLSPAERTALVYAWLGGATRPAQVTSATAVQPGDSFALGTPDGPRFTLELAPLPPEIIAARKPKPRPRRYSIAVWFGEIRRLFFARLYTISFVSLGARAWYAITSGAIFHPRILLPMLAILSGYSACGASSCAAMRYRSQVSTVQRQAEDCNQNLAVAQAMGGDAVEEYTFDQIVGKVTGSLELARAVQNDQTFAGMVKEEARRISLDTTGYRWMTSGGSAQAAFANWRERITSVDAIDQGTRSLLPYLAATPGRLQGDWDRTVGLRDDYVCTRGPLRLTWTQGRNLGLQVALDAYTPGDASAIEPAGRMAMIARTATEAGIPLIGDVPTTAEVLSEGRASCVAATDPDDRANLGRLVAMITEQVGRKAGSVPPPEDAFGTVARIAKLQAADIPEVDWTARPPPLDLSNGSPSSALKNVPGGEVVLKRTATIVARALVLPCRASLAGDRAKAQAVFGDLPPVLPCLLMDYRLTHE